MKVPSVTVILPVYNGGNFLASAIDSILKQTHDDFEFLIVDDGSADGSRELVASYAQRDPRVIVHLHPSNLGITAAMNTLCHAARGEFVAIMNQDDISIPERLEKQVAHLRSHPDIGALGSWVQVIDERGEPTWIKEFPTHPGMVGWSLLYVCSVLHPTAMVRLALLKAIGFYPEGYRGGTEDYALFMRLSEISRISNLGEVLLLYRRWEGQATQRNDDTQQEYATRIVRERLNGLLGIDVPLERARDFRGLAIDQYPRTLEDIRALADLICRLRTSYLDRFARDSGDADVISRDAGMRLWLLAALAARHSAKAALAIAASAIRMSPWSFAPFAVKVARRLNASGLRQARRLAGAG